MLHDMQNFLQEQKKRYADIRQYSDSYVPSFVDDLGIITLQKAIQQQQSVDVSSIFVCQYCKSSQRFAYASRYTLPYMTIKQLIHFPYTFFITYDGTFRSQVFERLFEYKKRAILLLASRQDM
ncbi:hypothetical protein GW750_08720 [bacterium]|nr:hypothetical protein [bacterium]